MKRYFLITIDTEGDNLWGVKDIKSRITTENARYLERFQTLCEQYGFVVTYLTNYEMANDKYFINFGLNGLKNGTLEIGSHEHAWNSPPYYPLVQSPAFRGKPYLGEYPDFVIRKKLQYLTSLLEDKFQCRITSHRGGRWYMDQRIAKTLCGLGYIVDCTCTPYISRANQPGWSVGSHGTDWSRWPYKTNILYNNDGQRLLEIPATVLNRGNGTIPAWFRPDGKNCKTMLGMIDYLCGTDMEYIEFMIHSSELMPSGSPTFWYAGQIEKLYEDLRIVFDKLREKGYIGIGLSDYAKLKLGE